MILFTFRQAGHSGGLISLSFRFRGHLHFIAVMLNFITAPYRTPLLCLLQNATILPGGIAALRNVLALRAVCFLPTLTDTTSLQQIVVPYRHPYPAIPSGRGVCSAAYLFCFLARCSHDALCLFQKIINLSIIMLPRPLWLLTSLPSIRCFANLIYPSVPSLRFWTWFLSALLLQS